MVELLQPKKWIGFVIILLFASLTKASAADALPILDSLKLLLRSERNHAQRQKIITEILQEITFDKEILIQKYLDDYSTAAKANNDLKGITHVYEIVGSKYVNNGRTSKAEKLYDSLKRMMEDSQFPAGVAKAIFYQGSLSLEKGDVAEGIKLMKEALDIYSNQEEVELEKARIQNYLGSYYRDSGNYQSANDWYSFAYETAKSSSDKNLEASVLNNLGRLYRKKAEYDTAKIFYLKSLKLNKELGDKKSIAGCYNNLGNMAHVAGNLEEALENYITSLTLKEELGFPKGISISYHNIGAVRFDLEEFELAKKDYEKSLRISETIEFKFLSIHNFLKLGNVERQLGNLSKAIEYHQKAIQQSTAINFEQGLIEGKAYLGEDYFVNKDFGNALDAYQDCLKMAEKNGRKNYISICLVYIAKCYMGIQELTREGDGRTVDYIQQEDNIEKLLLRGTQIAKEIDSVENMTASFEALQQFYREKNDFRKEALVSREYLAYRDTLFERQKVESIAEWSTKYETAEKEKEILVLEKEKELQIEKSRSSRNRFIAGILLLIALASAALIYFNMQHKVKRAKQIENLRTKISSDLHDDVGSMLSGLAMQAELLQISLPEADHDKLSRISKMGRSAMSRMRDAVWAMDARKDKFSDLLDRMREFAEETLVQADIPYELHFSGIDIDKMILPNFRQNIYLIFKESVTNIIKHAAPSKVVISLKNSNQNFTMSIKNDGVVVNKDYKTTGLGTSNMKMRAENIGGNITFDKSNGFEVILKSSQLG